MKNILLSIILILVVFGCSTTPEFKDDLLSLDFDLEDEIIPVGDDSFTMFGTISPFEDEDGDVEEPKGAFRIQIAAYLKEKMAEGYVAGKAMSDLSCEYEYVNLGAHGEWYRVFTGNYATHQEAKQAAQALLRSGKIKDFLIRDTSK